MQADNIIEIVQNFKQLPYRTILFDGVWGIGKTYAIDEVVKENANVCKISMFGLSDAKQIYHEALFQLVLKNNEGTRVSEFVNRFGNELSKYSKKVKAVKDIIDNFMKERELFILMSKKFSDLHIIIIDDLERMSPNVNLDEVLGIIEELKRCNNVKIIFVANEEKLENKELFEKYKEKVIDRIYHITERSQNIDWKNMGICADFITDFLKQHEVNNLRTLQKAQNFYDDVKLYCNKIEDVEFLTEIRWICFAIVVESTDNLYYKEPDENEQDAVKKSLAQTGNILEHRIMRYLTGIKSTKNLVTMLLEYYQNGIRLNIDSIGAEYQLFLQAGKKPNYYKTDMEIKRLLPVLFERISCSRNPMELNKFADEYAVWSDIIGEDNTLMMEKYRSKLHDMLIDRTLNGNGDLLSYDYDLWHIESKIIKDLYEEEREIAKKSVIENLVGHLTKSTKDKESFEYSYKLRKYSENYNYRDIITSSVVESLYNKNSFPIDIKNTEQYQTCYNIMHVLHHIDKERLALYCKKLADEYDKMSAYRINAIMKELAE